MKIYLISDCHFGHKAIEEFCNRPLDFEQKILKNIGELQKNSLLINLGDFCWNSDAQRHEIYMCHALCKNWFIIGNHDGKNAEWYMSHGWDWAGDFCQITYRGKRILFSHIPKKFDGSFDLNIHGHFHNSSNDTIRKVEPELAFSLDSEHHHLISIEKSRYKPIDLISLL